MGKAIVLTDCNFSASNIGRVTFLSTSPSEPSEPGVTLIDNNITFSISETSVFAFLEYKANSALTINLSGLGQIVILAGNNEGFLKFDSSTSERTATISISPTSDSKYRYVSCRNSLTIPASQTEPVVPTSLMIVGDREAVGSLAASEYFILNTATMKVVTSNSSPSSNEEYYGAITWSTGSNAASLANRGSYASLDITSNGTINITASIGGASIPSLSVGCVYSAYDYALSSFADLRALEKAVNNKTEASISLTSATGRTATNGSGFSGFTFLMLGDIDCAASHVEIGYSDDTAKRAFKGTIDGGCHTLKNIGGNCGVNGSSSQGGKIGNCLVGYGNNCTIRNLNLEGSVVNIASRGFATVLALYEGTCNIQNLYCNVNVSQASGVTSGCVLIAGWSSNSGVANLTGVIYDGTFVSNYSVSGLVNTSNSVTRCATIGVITYNPSSRGSGVLTAITTANIKVTNSYSVATLNITSGSPSEKVAIITNNSGINCYEAGTLSVSSAHKSFSSTSSPTCYSYNGMSGAVDVTKSEITSKFTDNNSFIAVEGWLPILFNRMARFTRIITSAKL